MLAALAVCVCAAAVVFCHRAVPVRVAGAGFGTFPHTTLWAWERREDLRNLDVQRYGIAYLDQTITIADAVESRPRLQPLLAPPGASVMAVVRIEAPARSVRFAHPELVSTIAKLILNSAGKPGVSALQIDFDAVQSQRPLYREVLQRVRAQMPPAMPLSMTALASWCAGDDWIADLPVQEAVPMFFRMGKDSVRAVKPGWEYPIREPLCESSAGVSMDEPWPKLRPGLRLYVFHPAGWNEVAISNLVSEGAR
jgi:hypothetical protein